MKGFLLFFFSAIVFIYPQHADSQPSENAALGKVKLGVIVPLTGPLAFFGKDYVKTHQLAAEENPELEKTFEVYWEDSAYDSKQAVSAFNKLVLSDKVDVVLSFGGPMLSALAPIAESKEVPFFATESAKADCEEKKFCSLFRNEEDDWGAAIWKVLRAENKKKIGIVKNQNQFMDTFVDAIIRTKNQSESVDILLDVSPDTTDLRTSVLNLRDKDIDALGVYFLPGSHHGFMKALKSIDKKLFLFGVEEFLVKENNIGFEEIIDGTRVIAPAYEPNYRKRFEAKFGYSAGFFYTPAFYDFLTLLSDTIKKDSRLRGERLVNAMHFSGERKGVSGEYSVKTSKKGVRSYSFPIGVYKVNGDNTVEVEQVIKLP